MKLIALFTCYIILYCDITLATSYLLPQQDSRIIGQETVHIAEKGDYFQALAEHYNVGFYALMAANPTVDPFLITAGASINIPTQMLLPYAKREGIVVNLAELRLYYFPPNENTVHVFPVGIGREGLLTPRIVSYISEKRENPTWQPTEATRQRHFKETGELLAQEILPGPDNPFGKHALRIGQSVYLLHGSNQRFGIGMRASAGCIRLYDDDIAWLFEHIALDTPIRIVDQAIKVSYEPDNSQLIEIHEPLSYSQGDEAEPMLTPAILAFVGNKKITRTFFNEQMKKQNGLVHQLPRK